ncbi:hypothetical protein [Micromonospora sp. IBSANI012]|uniref:hypothetical protein n=1 Tax=Micromonospora sp. IBSANI012 TaxID=3457761 RepID=UPI0040584605
MAFRTWGKLLFTAFGVSVLAGAGQLGIAYGFGIVRLNGAFTDVNRWPAQLAWVGWFAVTAAVVGAVVTIRLARRVGLPDGAGAQLAISGAAALGATVVAPLCMQPARAAELSTVDPVWAVGICAVVGAVVGAGAASAVLLRPPLGWNVALLTGAVWLIALVSVGPALMSTGALRSVRLGVLEPSWLDADAAQRLAMLILPAVALLAGAATGALARWRGHVPLVSGAAGAAGPVLLAFAYLTAGPGDSADRYQLAPYYGAVIAVAAGALGSATAALLRWPLFPATGAGNAAGGDDAIEPTDILRPLPDSPALSSASGDGTATVDLAGAAGASALAGSGTPTGADRAADRAATRATGPTPAHWDWPVTPGSPTPSGTRPDSGFALDAPAVDPVSATWPAPSGRTPDEPSYGDLPTGRSHAPEADAAGPAGAPQPRARRATPESRWTADPAAPTGEPGPAFLAGHRVESTEWDVPADREAPAGSATGVDARDGVDRDGTAGRITPAVPAGEPVVDSFPAAPPAVPSDGPRAAKPVQVPPTADPVQVPPTADPVQVPLASDPVQVPSAAGRAQVPPAAVPSDGPRAADPVQVAPVADQLDTPAAVGQVTPQVAVGSVAAPRAADRAEQPSRTEETAATTDHTATAEQSHGTEEAALTADPTGTAEPAEATTVTPRPRPKRTRKSRSAGSDEPVTDTPATTSDAASTTDAGPAAATTGSAASAATTGTAAPAAAATGTAAAGTGQRGSAKRAARAADPTAAPEPADSPAARSGADTAPDAAPERAHDRPRLDRPGLDRALDRTRLDRPELDTARLGEAGHDTTELDAARLDPAPLDPATLDPATLDSAPLDPATLDPARLDSAPLDPATLDPARLDSAPLDPATLDPAPLDSATLDPAALDPARFGPTASDSARFDPAASDSARSEYPSTGSTRDDVRDAPVPRPGVRASSADRIPVRHTPPTAGATPASAEPAPRPRHQLPDLNSAASWNAFPAPRPAPAPPRAGLPFPDHGPEEEPKPVTFRWDADDSRPGTPRTASRSTDLPAAEVPGAEPRGAEPSSEVEPEPAADRSRPKRSLFRRNKARGAEPPAESPEAEPLAAQDEEYVDWVAGLSRPLADNEPETESGRRSLRSGGRHHRD